MENPFVTSRIEGLRSFGWVFRACALNNYKLTSIFLIRFFSTLGFITSWFNTAVDFWTNSGHSFTSRRAVHKIFKFSQTSAVAKTSRKTLVLEEKLRGKLIKQEVEIFIKKSEIVCEQRKNV